MEVPPYTFESITHFSIRNISNEEKRLNCVTELTLQFKSRDRDHSLVLISPCPPYSRVNAVLDVCTFLTARSEEIDRILAFPEPGDKKAAKSSRIEFKMENGKEFHVSCKRIKGLPTRTP